MMNDEQEGMRQEDWDAEHAEALASIRPRPSRLNAKSIGTVMRKLMAQKGYGQTAAAQVLLERWPAIVGLSLAATTRPGNIARGVLIVSADSSPDIQELYFQKRKIIAKLNASLPELKISNIRARVGS